jgi:dolichol-phosphate mannosyltransferase
MTSAPRITVLVALYQEEEGVGSLVQGLRDVGPSIRTFGELEIVFVDDGSTDATHSALLRLAPSLNLPFRVVRHDENRGLGAALKTGAKEAHGEWIVTLDADGTYDPVQVPELLRVKDETGADIVVGSPYHPQGRTIGSTGWRLALSRALSALYRRAAPVRLYTYTSMFRVQTAEAMRSTFPDDDGFLAVTEWLMRAAVRGYSIREVPATLSVRTTGRSKMKIVRVGWAHLGYVVHLALHRTGEP